MSTAQILLLGAVAGLTIFIGLPMGRVHDTGQAFKAFLSATATGILLFLALAAGSILYVVMELLNVCRLFTSKTVTAWGILFGLTLGFATDFVLVAAGV